MFILSSKFGAPEPCGIAPVWLRGIEPPILFTHSKLIGIKANRLTHRCQVIKVLFNFTHLCAATSPSLALATTFVEKMGLEPISFSLQMKCSAN